MGSIGSCLIEVRETEGEVNVVSAVKDETLFDIRHGGMVSEAVVYTVVVLIT